MDFKPVVKVAFNEELQTESYYFLKRLINSNYERNVADGKWENHRKGVKFYALY